MVAGTSHPFELPDADRPPPPASGDAAGPAVYPGVPAAPPRTLLDVLRATVSGVPDALALDDGRVVLSYRELDREVTRLAGALRAAGVGVGDRVGVRLPSGTAGLYLGILAVLAVGAAYVPADADDPDERAALVFDDAGVCAVLGTGADPEDRRIRPVAGVPPAGRPGAPGPDDDAWVIFTSGSTGRPKGVAVTHRAAAAFVDAEARLFVPDAPIGPGDRVLAGLSVAFDASCEEMWLAWRHGACLVPAPRALVRGGAELGPWLRDQRITVVSTVPTLAACWSPDLLAGVRLLVVGGEACPPEVVRRFARDGREVWNTYGPTETTVVACASRLRAGEPVRIGLPLAGWRLAVVDGDGCPVRFGEVGELVVGGVGLGRYLDPTRDAERYAALPAVGWARAYRTGDLVRADPEGLTFLGRGDDQVKIGGRRVELGEIEAALLALPGVAAAVAAVRRTPAGGEVLAGYLVPVDGDPARFDRGAALRRLRDRLPAALVPRLVVLPDLPAAPSGKVDRRALPWPPRGHPAGPRLPGAERPDQDRGDETVRWLRGLWADLLGYGGTSQAGRAWGRVGPGDDFFDLGGTSIAAARLVSAVRARHPEASVADLYRHPTPAALAERLRAMATAGTARPAAGGGRPRWTGWVQTAAQPLLHGVAGLRWLLALALAGHALAAFGVGFPDGSRPWLPTPSLWVLLPAALALFTLPGRVLLAAGGARLLRGPLTPGEHRHGGVAHLRLWAAERLVAALDVAAVTGTPLAAWYARLLGCRVGRGVDLRALPPVTGLAAFGDGCAVEPEADLAGWWLDGDTLHLGPVHVGAGSRIGARGVLLPGADVGDGAELLPGACVAGAVPAGECWGGSPAARQPAPARWPGTPAPRSRRWDLVYLCTPAAGALLPWVTVLPAALLLLAVPFEGGSPTLSAMATRIVALVLLGTAGHALLVAGLVRLVGRALRPGTHPAHSLPGWSAWVVQDLLHTSHRTLFPLYASIFTPVWLRWLGARVGRAAEVSTVLALPGLLEVADSAFLADHVLAAPYELRGGWLRIGPSRVGVTAFVGNSGIVGPDRAVGDRALIGVLTDAPPVVPEGSSWLGNPPVRLRRVAERHDQARTFRPSRRLRAARGAVELCRAVPVLLSGLLRWGVVFALAVLWHTFGGWIALLLCGPVLCLAGLVAAGLATAAKWLLVGRFTTGRHPLWCAFVWRNELYDTFVEVLAAPWLLGTATGTPVLTWWLRSLGARVGPGVWCETYWLPEPDLISVAEGSCVNRGCVLQTHLFHDRVMRLGPVSLGPGAVLGPHSIALPGSRIGAGSSVGAGSLVMAAETVPDHGRWQGAPLRRMPPPAGRGRGPAGSRTTRDPAPEAPDVTGQGRWAGTL
ncbi:Pls/PosA family non-ribosomal peptide synthetase [Streptomyces sp. B6B3]|uniref:Pls/PosA family non-ribosomal peptide synthetase n=1 Tax=Streptomyces sp. B6B3 TaxID=3153570 RepID=UPI00325D671D